MNIQGLLEINFEASTALSKIQLEKFNEGLAKIIAVSNEEINSLAEDLDFEIESAYPISIKEPLKIVI